MWPSKKDISLFVGVSRNFETPCIRKTFSTLYTSTDLMVALLVMLLHKIWN